MTWADGAITITEAALLSPGILAATLVHETAHFDQRTKPHGARVGRLEREVAAFGSVHTLDVQSKLGLTAADIAYLELAHAEFMASPESYFPSLSSPASQFDGPANPPDIDGFGQFGADAEALARLNDQSSGLRRSIEQAADARSQRLIDRMNAGNRAVTAAFREADASRCNLMAVDAEAGRFKVRVGRGQPVNLRYADDDGFYVAAMFAQACTATWVTTPCNDAMPVVARRWKDKDFRQSVMPAVGTDDEINACFWHLSKKLKPTDDFEQVREKVAKFQADARGEPESVTPSGPKPPRPPREPRPEPRPDIPHCRRMGAWCDGTQDPK